MFYSTKTSSVVNSYERSSSWILFKVKDTYFYMTSVVTSLWLNETVIIDVFLQT